MPDATMRDYVELAAAVMRGDYPILPKPKWGQDAAFIAWTIDHLRADRDEARTDRIEACNALETCLNDRDQLRDQVHEFRILCDPKEEMVLVTQAEAKIPHG